MIPIVEERPAAVAHCPDCADHDEDCNEIENKEHCWLYAPERGMCPLLRGKDAP